MEFTVIHDFERPLTVTKFGVEREIEVIKDNEFELEVVIGVEREFTVVLNVDRNLATINLGGGS